MTKVEFLFIGLEEARCCTICENKYTSTYDDVGSTVFTSYCLLLLFFFLFILSST